MQFYVDSNTGPTMSGKRLKKHLQAAGYDVKVTQCYRLMAQMMGYRGWQELTASVGTEEASLGDDYVDDAEFERRRFPYAPLASDTASTPRSAMEVSGSAIVHDPVLNFI